MNLETVVRNPANFMENNISCGFAYKQYNSQVTDLQAIEMVHYAIDHGINYFDTSPFYGHGTSETVLGKALSQRNREEFFVSTKTGRYYTEDPKDKYVAINGRFDFSAENTRRSVMQSLEALQLEYVDIVFCHDVEFADDINVVINETIPTLNQLREEGYLKYIGISGLLLDVLTYILVNSRIKVDYVLSYTKNTLQNDTLLQYIKKWDDLELGVNVINASSMGMGLLSYRGPPGWHPAPERLKEACREAARAHQEEFSEDIGNLAISYSVQKGEEHGICTTLVGFTTIEEIDNALGYTYNDAAAKLVKDILSPVHNLEWPSESEPVVSAGRS